MTSWSADLFFGNEIIINYLSSKTIWYFMQLR